MTVITLCARKEPTSDTENDVILSYLFKQRGKLLDLIDTILGRLFTLHYLTDSIACTHTHTDTYTPLQVKDPRQVLS